MRSSGKVTRCAAEVARSLGERNQSSGWVARCPAPGDQNPSPILRAALGFLDFSRDFGDVQGTGESSPKSGGRHG